MNNKSPWWQLLKPKNWLFIIPLLLMRLMVFLPYQWQMNIGKALGQIIYWTGGKSKHIAEINLKLCFPHLSEAERQKLVIENFQALGMSIMETAIAWFAPTNKLPPFEVIGFEHIQNLLQQKKGILLISAHLSCLEIAGRLVSYMMDVTAIYRPQKLDLLDHFARYYRGRTYPKIIAREQLRELIRSLQQGAAVWYTPDVDAGIKNSVFVPFFNIPAATITTSSRLVKAGNAAAITAFFYRKEDLSGYQIVFSEPLDNFPSGDDTADATRINHLIETAILKMPDQYLWQYRRFKTRPAGEARLYSGKKH